MLQVKNIPVNTIFSQWISLPTITLAKQYCAEIRALGCVCKRNGMDVSVAYPDKDLSHPVVNDINEMGKRLFKEHTDKQVDKRRARAIAFEQQHGHHYNNF